MRKPTEIDIWTVFLDSPSLMLKVAPQLSDAENQRARRLRDPVRRGRFVTARGVLREILGGYVDAPANRLEFSNNAFGKPSLGGHPDLRFNLSHSGPWMILAVHFASIDPDSLSGHHREFGPVAEIGIDIERIRPNWRERSMAIARKHFASAELVELEALDPDQQAIAVARLWACKEAYAKAKGLGLKLPMRSYAITGAGDRLPRLQMSTTWPEDVDDFLICTLPAPDDHVAALAFGPDERPSSRLILHRWPRSETGLNGHDRLSIIDAWGVDACPSSANPTIVEPSDCARIGND